MSITIEEAQQQVDTWIKTIGVRYFNELTNTAILMEEVGEVARIMARKYGEQSFKKSQGLTLQRHLSAIWLKKQNEIAIDTKQTPN
jgi:NTP pyrophosphatase (non-canonical NTP hydrolase)